MAVAAFGLAAIVMIFANDDGARERGAGAQGPVAGKPAWLDINRPLRLYALDVPELDGVVPRYEARRHETGGGRRDTLAFVSAPASGGALLVSLYRVGEEAAPRPTFYVEMARRAAEAGLAVVRAGAPGPMSTRFGAFETADLTLEGGGSEIACLGFRLVRPQAPGEADMRISGLSCARAGEANERGWLACQIGRLDLVSAGDDRELRQFFVEAERRRDRSCQPGRHAQAAKSSWLEPRAMLPALKGAQTPSKDGRKR